MKKILIILFSLFLFACDTGPVLTPEISADEFVKMQKEDLVLLDVRTDEEFKDGHIPGAINLPVGELPILFSQLTNKEQKIVVYCRSGKRAGKAIDLLTEKGYTNLVHLDGDFLAWHEESRPIAKP